MTTRRNGVFAWIWFAAVVLLSSPGFSFGLTEWLRVAGLMNLGDFLAGLNFLGAMTGPFALALAFVPLLALLLTRRAHLALKLTAVGLVAGSIFFLVHFRAEHLLG